MDNKEKGHRKSKRMTVGPDPTTVGPDQGADVESGGPRIGSRVFRLLQRSGRGLLGVRIPRGLWPFVHCGHEGAVPAGKSGRNRTRDARCRRVVEVGAGKRSAEK